MKTIFKFSAMVAFVLSTVVSTASETKSSLKASFSAKSMIFQLDGLSKKANVVFMDIDEVVLYSENVVNKKKYAKKFDLRNLKLGIYSLSMDDDLKTIKYILSVEDKNVKILSKEETYKPTFNRKEGVVYLNFLNSDSKQVSIIVMDNDSRVIFEETITDSTIVEKAFNFENAYEGNYIVVMKKGDNTYYNAVAVD